MSTPISRLSCRQSELRSRERLCVEAEVGIGDESFGLPYSEYSNASRLERSPVVSQHLTQAGARNNEAPVYPPENENRSARCRSSSLSRSQAFPHPHPERSKSNAHTSTTLGLSGMKFVVVLHLQTRTRE